MTDAQIWNKAFYRSGSVERDYRVANMVVEAMGTLSGDARETLARWFADGDEGTNVPSGIVKFRDE